MTTALGAICAICVATEPSPTNQRFAVTSVGPLPVCGRHVDDALTKLGYTAPALDIAGWLEQIDAKELQTAALEKIEDYGVADSATGAAFLAVLVEFAKGQAAA